MRKFSLISFIAVFAVVCTLSSAWSYPLPTNSISENLTQVETKVSTVSMVKERVNQTVSKIKENSLWGVVGMLKNVASGNIGEFVKDAKKIGFDKYKLEQEKKEKAKKEAGEESQKTAKNKFEKLKEGISSARKKIDENREKAEENIKAKVNKAYNWVNKKNVQIDEKIGIKGK